MSRMPLAALFLVSLWILSPVAAGDTPSKEQVRAWLEAEIKQATAMPMLPDVAFSYAFETHWPKPREEIERLREIVRNAPMHPDAWMIRVVDERNAAGPETTIMTFRFGGSKGWRICQDRPDKAENSYMDIVVTPGHAWQMTPRQLVLVDPKQGYPAGRQLNTMEGDIRHACAALLHGGLVTSASDAPRISSLEAGDGRWTCTLTDSRGQTRRVSGHWDGEHNRGFVTRIESTRPDPGGTTEATIVCGDWLLDAATGRWVAKSTERHFSDGSIEFAFRFLGAKKEAEGFFEQATAPLHDESIDPIRGAVTATSVIDYTGQSHIERKRTPSGDVETVIGHAPVAGIPRWRLVGWLSAGALLSALLVIRLRRTLRAPV